MKNRRRITVSLALATLLAGAALASAQPGPGRGPRGEPGWSRLAQRLELTDVQKQAIETIREEGRARRLETRKKMVQLEAQLHTLMLADAPDEAAVVALVRQIGDLRIEQQAGRLKLRLAIRKQLTPEQRTQFILMEGRGGRGHGRGRQGPGHENH